MANGVIGGELNIQGLEEGINKIEKKLTNLSQSLSTNSTRIIDAFREISTQGVDTLVGKLDELNTTISKINVGANLKEIGVQATASIDGVNRLTDALKAQSEVSSNQKVKENAIASRKAYEDQLRMYEKMFDTAEAKRPDLVKKGDTLQEINIIDTRLTELMSKIHKLNNEMQLFKSMESGQTLHTEDYAYIGQVADELKKLIAEYEALYNKRGQLQQQLKTYKTEEEQLAQAQANQRKNQEKNTTFEGAKEFSEKATNINRQKKAIEYLTQARAKLNLTTYEGRKKAQELTDAIAQHEKELKRATQSTEEYRTAQRKLASKRLEHIYSVSPNLALNYSQQAKSINEQVLAIKRLKSARDNLNRGNFATEEEYRKKIEQINDEIKRQQKEVDELTNKNSNLGKSHRNLMDTAGQLQRKLALLFSVSAIQGYVNKLITVRGEFELQAKSLKVLLQNKDEANRLWNQTVQLAVKSPFTVKELVSYTKQLAAYRIESEKLFETNKMLADVSAGLGVDMGRLILAFGQVKAANFLRGTELRQFSEAGVNMLDELAKRFTVLEGRAVSVGEVFERISKRMVTFADVEAVFETITSEGGIFYQMQEKQAETLRGMITNLKDQFELMLNDVGMSREGILKGLVTITQSLVQNWRAIVPLIDFVAGIMITRLLQKGMMGILRMTKGVVPLLKQWATALRGATVEATAMGTALGKVSKANAWLAVIGLVASLGYAIYDCVTSASKLEEELGRIDTDLSQRLEESISGYISLAKTATDASKSIEEQEEALIKLNSAYEDILPQEMLKIEYLENLKGNYEAVTDAMRLYYDTLAIEQKKAKVEELHGENIIKNTTDLINDIKDTIRESNYSQELKDYLLASVGGAVNSLVYEAKSGKFKGDIDAFISVLFGRIAEGTDISGNELATKLFGGKASFIDQLDFGVANYKIWTWDLEDKGVIKNLRELTGSLNDYKEALEGVEGPPDVKVPFKEKEGHEKARKAFGLLEDLMNEYVNFVNDNIDQDVDWDKLTPQIDEEKLNALISLFPELESVLDDFYYELKQNAQGGEVELKRVLPTLKEFLYESAGEIIKANSKIKYSITPLATEDLTKLKTNYNELDLSYPFVTMENAAEKANTAVDNLVEKTNKKISNLKFNDVARQIFNLMEEISNANNVSMDIFSKLTPDTTESIVSYRDKVEKELNRLKQALKDYQTAKSSALAFNFAETYLETAGVETEEELNTLISLIEKFYKALGGSEKNTGQNDIFSQRLSFVKKLNKEYKDLLKKFNGRVAVEKISILKNEALELGFDWDNIDWDNFDKSVNELFQFVSDNAKNKKQRVQVGVAQAEIQLDYDKEEVDKETKQIVDKIQDKIDKYELSVELDKIGIPKDIAKSLFGIETTDLADIKKELEGQISILQEDGGSDDRIKALQDELDKVNEMEAKAQVERLKEYSKYLYKAMSKRTQITIDQLKKEKEIEKTFVLTEDVAKKNNWVNDGLLESLEKAEIKLSEIDITAKIAKEDLEKMGFSEAQINAIIAYNKQMQENIRLAKTGVKLEAEKALKKQDWEDFKETGAYADMFSNLESMGTQALETLMSKLDDYRKSLTLLPEDMRAFMQAYYKVQQELSTRSLFPSKDSIKEGLKATRDLPELEKKRIKSDADLTERKKAVQTAEENLVAAEKEYATALAIADANNQIVKEKQQAVIVAKQNLANAQNALKQAQSTADADKASVDATKAKKELLIAQLQSSSAQLTAGKQAFDGMLVAIQNVFGEFDEGTQQFFQSVGEIVGGIATVETGLSQILNGQVFTGTITAITGLFQTIGGFMGFGNNDWKKEKEIKRLTKSVRDLESAYKDLERAIDSAYSVETLKGGYEESIDNINKRITSTYKMIDAERDKKDTDQGRIDEWLEQIKELEREKKELQEEIVTGLGGSYDIRNTTREFVEAWIEAFNETGNGLHGLEENFKEFFKNILIEQAIMKGAGTLMQPLLDEINKSLEDDFKVSSNERENINSVSKEVFDKLNKYLTDMFGDDSPLNEWITESGNELTGLQKGIQGITESQADIIAAYLNSMRAYVADNNLKLAQMLDTWTNTEVENPMVAQLKIIATQTTAIHDLLGGLTKSGHSEGGKGLKVFIS